MKGIYRILNIVTNKSYVGQSKDIQKRIKRHKNLLRSKKHENKHLQSSWELYNEEDFIFEVLEICDDEDLFEREIYFISNLSSFESGFNKTSGGDGIQKYKHTEEAKRKISEQSKKFKMSQEHKEKLLASITGRKKSDEEIEKIRNKARGRKISESHKQKLIDSTKGKPLSEDHRRKISEACKGRTISESQRLDISKALINNKNAQKLSQDQKIKIIDMFLQNKSLKINQLAQKYNVSPSTIYALRNESLKIKKES